MKECKFCKEEHTRDSNFCTVKCARAYSGSKSKGTKKPRKSNPPITKICGVCKNEFTVNYNKRKQKTCSRSCARKSTGGWNNHDKVDWSAVHRKAYENGNNYVAGGTTEWLVYKDIKVQGSYELRVCEILDELKESNKIKDWHYSTTRIKYEFEDITKTYIIDFTIDELDGSQKHIEVKGRERDLDKVKWNAAKSQGLNLEVWRKEDIFN